MSYRADTTTTAILAMAVSCYGYFLSGCASTRQMDELKAQVSNIEAQNRQTQAMVARVDSVLAVESEANKRLRYDVTTTVDELQRQIASLIENSNDLTDLVRKLQERQMSVSRISSSPGAQTEPATTGQQPLSTTAECDSSYDSAFILTRRNEYDRAIATFQRFLEACGKHHLAENAYYWMGECYYSLEQYDQAIKQFEHLISNYRSSANTSRALYKLARSKQELGKKQEAKKVYQQIIDEFPSTLEAEQAKDRLKDLK
ncbi:MAG TPA: tol-pal system protein YbgF [Candidatus Deferrimicrobium sp.]|nr:tol-pal system protein YbgF [Candidatus Deferrimicrobium sp.]